MKTEKPLSSDEFATLLRTAKQHGLDPLKGLDPAKFSSDRAEPDNGGPLTEADVLKAAVDRLIYPTQ